MFKDRIDNPSDFQKKVMLSFGELFEKAFKSKFDFLFIQTLFGAHPLCFTPGREATASMHETITFVHNLINFIEKGNSLEDIRIGLTIYCHIYEANFIPRIVHNLITVRQGKLDWFPFKLTNNKWEMSTDRKIKQIAEKDRVIGELMKELYDSNIRNAFFHSDYYFDSENIILTADRNINMTSISYEKLASKINNMLFFFQVFTYTLLDYRREFYHEGDVIYGHSSAERYKLIVDVRSNELIGLESTDEEPCGEYLKQKNESVKESV